MREVVQMRKVIDSNMMQSEVLRAYLSHSRANYAVLTDYVAMEAYKGDTLHSIYRSMEILATRPKQVIVLKGTQAICGMRGRRAGLQRRMIDESQTRGFEEYCRDLQAAKNGNRGLEESMLALGREATSHMDRILVGAREMPEVFDDVAKSYSQEDLRLLRSGRPLTHEALSRTVRNIRVVVATIFRDHPKVNKLPPANELGNTFIFRFSLCAYVWALRWISVGGAAQTKPGKLRNDMVDINLVVYGTFFDGLLTADEKASELHQDVLRWLSALRDYTRTTRSSRVWQG
jgi:hypothetical protein